MAYITNQWLKGEIARNRGHDPIKVTIDAMAPGDEFDTAHRIAAHVQLTRGDGDYQILRLLRDDITTLLPYLISQAHASAKSSAATIALDSLEDGDLAQFLEELFVRRRAKK